MINLRSINKFYLSGGWSGIQKDIEYLKTLNIKAILDLQATPSDVDSSEMSGAINFIKETVKESGIDYLMLPMSDDEFNVDLGTVLYEGTKFLSEMEKKYPAKKEKILIKCGAGISRSPAQLINYLCQTRSMSFIDALSYVRMKEDLEGLGLGVGLNPIFYEHLKTMYPDKKYE